MQCTLRKYRNGVKNLIARHLPNCMDSFSPKRPFQEPDYTAGLTIGLPKLLNASTAAARRGLRFGGCFIHQKPYVTYMDGNVKRTCELGDLLVLCREQLRKREHFNAALLQLKMAHCDKKVDRKQLNIYMDWPEFSFGKKFDAKSSYYVSPKTVTQGALYSFVHKPNNTSALRFTVAPPDEMVVRDGIDSSEGMQLQEFLADFVIWQSGRAISGWQGCSDEWSRLIWDILGQIRNAVFTRNNIGANGVRRLQGGFFNFLLEEEQIGEPIQDTQTIGALSDELPSGFGLLFIDKAISSNIS